MSKKIRVSIAEIGKAENWKPITANINKTQTDTCSPTNSVTTISYEFQNQKIRVFSLKFELFIQSCLIHSFSHSSFIICSYFPNQNHRKYAIKTVKLFFFLFFLGVTLNITLRFLPSISIHFHYFICIVVTVTYKR